MRLCIGVDVGGPSHDRCAVTVVEEFEVQDGKNVFAVEYADRMKVGAETVAQARAVEAVALAMREKNYGVEPTVVVEYNSVGVAVVQILDTAVADGRLDRRVQAVTLTNTSFGRGESTPGLILALAEGAVATSHSLGSNRRDLSVQKNVLVGNTYNLWVHGRVKFAADLPNLRRLREEMYGFRPKETATGATTFGNDASLVEYDDQVVSLMYALYFRGRGVPRFIDRSGKSWPSRLIAASHLGGDT